MDKLWICVLQAGPIRGVSQNWEYLFGGPPNEDYDIWGSILESPCFGKLPRVRIHNSEPPPRKHTFHSSFGFIGLLGFIGLIGFYRVSSVYRICWASRVYRADRVLKVSGVYTIYRACRVYMV